MTIYDDLQEVFADLAPEFKQDTITIVSIGAAPGKPWKPGMQPETPTVIDGFARGVSSKYIMRGQAQQGDTQVSFPGGTVTPKVGDVVDINGKRFNIVTVIRKPQAGTVVAWTVIARFG